jgi:soluble lytic murein transglycosylase
VFFVKWLWFPCLVLAALAAESAALDDDFLAANEAFRAGDAARLERHAKRFEGHLLEPYFAYWQLNLRLEQATDDEVRAFLADNQASPLSGRLRNEWLKLLGSNQRWELFDQQLPLANGDDIEITCYALQSRMRVNPGETLPRARPLWFVARDLPESCTPLFNVLHDADLLSTGDMWTRIRLALEIGRVSLARRIAEWLPKGQAPAPHSLEAIASSPAQFLEQRKFDLQNRAGREAVIFAAHRLARTSPQAAARHWKQLEDRFDREERAYVWGLIAYLGARQHDPEALDWYRRAGDLSDLQLAWKARAALRARAWPEALVAIEAMTEKESSAPAWRYWKARALNALEREEEAEQIFGRLAVEFNFYGQLAVEELGGRIATPDPGYKPGAEEVRAVSQAIGIRRALELYRLKLRVEASREWRWAIRGFGDRQLLAAAELARRHKVYDRAIGTAERTVALHDFGLRYLAPYREVLKSRVAQMDLDEAWVYGLIREESRFIADARSRAGAGGLMQITPGTARWVAKKLGLKNWRWSRVSEVDTNVSLGTYYLRYVLDTFDDHPVLASAAYNAGPGRVRAWRPEAEIEGAIYAETIPLSETRDFVKNVMANATYYAHAFSQQMQSLRQRLGTVGPQRRDAEPPLDDAPGTGEQ